MRAAVYDEYGPPEVVTVREIDDPTPVEDEVVVRVVAASVNRADLDYLGPRPGFLRAFTGIRRPRNGRIGVDAAGVVVAVGPEVTYLTIGDRVFGDLLPFGAGAFAEAVRAPERAFAPIPDGMSFEDAATLPHAAVLAVQGLRLANGRTVEPGMRVLIDGASGNVGPFAVQVAKAMGAEVTGVARTEKIEFLRSLGADHVIDYTTSDYTRSGERYDWILAVDAHHGILEVRRALARNGVYLTLGGSAWPILSAIVVGAVATAATSKRTGLMLWWKPFHRPDVERLETLMQDGAIKPAIDRTFALDDVVGALHWVDDGHARGKVLVVP